MDNVTFSDRFCEIQDGLINAIDRGERIFWDGVDEYNYIISCIRRGKYSWRDEYVPPVNDEPEYTNECADSPPVNDRVVSLNKGTGLQWLA